MNKIVVEFLGTLFFLYVMPTIVVDILVTKTVEKLLLYWPANYGFNSRISSLIFMSVHLIFVILTMAGTYWSIASTFLPMFFVMFPLFGTPLILYRSGDNLCRGQGSKNVFLVFFYKKS